MPQPGKQVGRRRTMYADGGNIPQIDEESPIISTLKFRSIIYRQHLL
jgi:hypothetical protein